MQQLSMLDGGATLTRTPGFSSALPHALARWRERGGLLVVPRRDLAARLLLVEAEAGAPALGREAVTFAGLRGRAAAAAGIADPEPPAAIEVRLALREALATVDLGPLGESARAPGFLAAAERALAELRAARVPPARTAAAAATPVARTVAAIHAAAAAVPLPGDGLWAVADAAAGIAAFPAVTVAGFDDLVPAQWALLGALGRVAPVEVVMPFDPARPAHEARRARQARWQSAVAATAGAGAPPPGPPALAARLFDDGPPPAGRPDVRLVGAAGTRGMLRTALDEALAAVDVGVAPHEVALVVPRLADLRDDLERLLDEWGVPARMTSRARVLEAPLVLALTHLLRLGELDPEAPGALDHLLGWLRTPYSGAERDDVDLFEATARRAGLAARGELMGRWAGPAIAPARRLVAAARQGPRAQLAALVEAGWDGLRRAADADGLPARADLRDRAALGALAGLAAAVGGEGDGEGDEEDPRRPRGPLPPGAVGELVADLATLAREEPPGALEVHDLASLRGSRHRVVVIAGLDGDGIPAGPAADPLLGDLRGPLADLLPPRAPGTSESRLRFVHAVDAAAERLVLVRRTVDDEGRELAPSPYWIEACRIAGRPPGALDRADGARGDVAASAAAARTEREALRAMALDGLVAPGALAEAAGRRSRAVGLPPDAFHDRGRIRVTDLETYLQCPYGWFRDRYLAPVEMEELLDPRFEGTLAHAVLQGTYERMRDAGAGPCGPATLDRYRAALEEVLPAVCADARPPGPAPAFDALQERLRRHLGAMLGREAALGSRLVPSHFERTMEDPSLVPGITVAGTVDRLDLGEDGAALVVDYKRTGGDFRRKGAVATRLQLPLYGLMARRDLGLAAAPAGGLYMGLLRPRVDGAVCDDVPGAPGVRTQLVVTRQEWDELAGEALEAARGAVAGIRAGALEAPDPGACPRWCRCGDLWR